MSGDRRGNACILRGREQCMKSMSQICDGEKNKDVTQFNSNHYTADYSFVHVQHQPRVDWKRHPSTPSPSPRRTHASSDHNQPGPGPSRARVMAGTYKEESFSISTKLVSRRKESRRKKPQVAPSTALNHLRKKRMLSSGARHISSRYSPLGLSMTKTPCPPTTVSIAGTAAVHCPEQLATCTGEQDGKLRQ